MVPKESVLHQNRDLYYQAIQDSKQANDSGLFIEFTLSALYDTISVQEKHQVRHQVEHVSGIIKGRVFGR
jgi:Fic family protein